jgi:hypothetical protein
LIEDKRVDCLDFFLQVGCELVEFCR